MTTGIYSRSSVDLINSYLQSLGIRGLFDYIIANEIEWDGSKIIGLDEKIMPGKGNICEHMAEIGVDPTEMGFIDNEDISPLHEVGFGYAAPTAKEGFREECRRLGIPTPNDWREIGNELELWQSI